MRNFIPATFFLVICCTAIRASENLLPVPLVRQATTYSCGPAALLGVLAYFGNTDWNENELMKLAGTTEEGTDLGLLTKAAGEAGLKAKWVENATLDDLKGSLARKQPVIVEAQAWSDEPPKVPFTEVWEDGHFLVVVGLDDQKIYFMDPSHLGSLGYMTLKDFKDRWHDISVGNKRRYHTALYFDNLPKPPEKILPIP